MPEFEMNLTPPQIDQEVLQKATQLLRDPSIVDDDVKQVCRELVRLDPILTVLHQELVNLRHHLERRRR